MSQVGSARRARRWALIVPALMSGLMVLVIGEPALQEYGVLLLVAWLATAALAQTPVGQRWTARAFHAARAPLTHQRYTLAPVADVLLGQGLTPPAPRLLVGRSRGVAIHGIGTGTLVVTRGFIEAVRVGDLPPRLAAAAIIHEVTVMRAGLTCTEPALSILLAPWHLWLSFLALGWGIVSEILPLHLRQLCLLVSWGVGLWLGYSEHPIHFAGSAVLTLAFLTWWTITAWERARAAVGDEGLVHTDLGGIYADFLVHHFTDDHTLDRAVRLRHPQRQDDRPTTARSPLLTK